MSINLGSNPFPDNVFFENAEGQPMGASWNGEVMGMKATYGVIEPGIYAFEARIEPEIIVVHEGKLVIDRHRSGWRQPNHYDFKAFSAHAMLPLPLDEFSLRVVPEKDHLVPAGNRLVYTSLYPGRSEDGILKAIKAATTIGGYYDLDAFRAYSPADLGPCHKHYYQV